MPGSENNPFNLHQILSLLQEINRGHKEKINDLADLMHKEDQPEIVLELCEAIMLTLLQAEASEFRWRNKLENISPVQTKKRDTAPLHAEKILIWENNEELVIDLRKATFIPKLSNLVKALVKEIENHTAGKHDLAINHSIDPEELPELIHLGIRKVLIYARSEMASKLYTSIENLSLNLNTVFHSLQLPYWGGAYIVKKEELAKISKPLPSLAGEKQIPNLLFPFHLFSKPGETSYFCFIEHEPLEGVLRITIDDPQFPIFNLENIPHAVVKGLDHRIQFQDLRYLAKAVYFEILRAKENSVRQLAYHFGTQKDYGIFRELQQAGLNYINTIMIYWSNKTEKHFMNDSVEETISLIGRILLALEEKIVIEQLVAGKRLEVMFDDDRSAFLDISMRGQWLNLALDDRRSVANTFYYLNRMPHMNSLAQKYKQALKDVDVFLIHHLTPEVLAVIKGLDEQGCNFLQVLFVRYNPNVPSSYREAVLTMPEDRFHFISLQKCSEGDFVKDYFTLSDQFSSLYGFHSLKALLDSQKLDFTQAMYLCAGQTFLKKAFRAHEKQTKLLIIEDGGYLAPFVNQLCLEGKTIQEALQHYHFSPQEIENFAKIQNLNVSLDTWLTQILVGSIEHTRNGYDALVKVYEKFQQLAFPACTIAISDLKRYKEGDEVAASIIHAVESMLHILGFVISQRNVLVLGSKGTIGGPLRRHLLERISGHVWGVDLKVDATSSQDIYSAFSEVVSLDKLPDEILAECDTFIGVIGNSILVEKQLLRIFQLSRSYQLFFVSGSTKKAEFTDLLQFLSQLQTCDNPTINGIAVLVEETEVRDPGTYTYLGKCIRISAAEEFSVQIQRDSHTSSYFLSPPPEGYLPWKELFLLGDLMPINFFYSGVPTEIIDLVLTQLMQISLGIVQHDANKDPLPKRVLAVDVDIDDQANLI